MGDGQSARRRSVPSRLGSSAADYTAVQSASRMTDDVLGQASAQMDALNDQRGTFKGVGSKLTELAAVAPQLNNMIGWISRRQKRDKLVLGAVIGVCSGSLLLYGMG